MNKEERLNIATGAVQTLMEDFEKSVKRTVAIFGDGKEALEKFIFPQLMDALDGNIPIELSDWIISFNNKEGQGFAMPFQMEKIKPIYTGERRNLAKLLDCNDLTPFQAINSLIGQGRVHEIKPGDFFMIPVRLPASCYGNLDFEGVDIKETELVVSHVFSSGRVVFQFEDVLFHSAINLKNTNKGGFTVSALAEYLNKNVESIFGRAAVFLVESNDGLKITLPTKYEVFGDEEDMDESTAVNWSETPVQLDWFKKRKNRIRTKDNDTAWWWLASPSASSAADFCSGSGSGGSGGSIASAAGGVAPAICVS